MNSRYEYRNDVPDEDRRVLEKHKDAISSALMFRDIIWTRFYDTRGGVHYRAISIRDRSTVLCQLEIGQIRDMDSEYLKGAIIGGEFMERHIP